MIKKKQGVKLNGNLCNTSCTHVLGHLHPCPGKHSDHPVCGDHAQCPGLVQSQPERRLEPAVLTQDEPVQSLGTALMRH